MYWQPTYGPYHARVLANWVDPDPQYAAYFTQRNADNFAFFALAKYVQKVKGAYPNRTNTNRKKPSAEPRDAATHEPPLLLSASSLDLGDGDEEDEGPGNIPYPGCGDRFGPMIPASEQPASISSAYAPPAATATPAPGSGGSQQVAIASYIDPLADPAAWTRLLAYPSSKMSVLVANVVNGPDSTVNENWKKVIDQAAASGKTAIGYVRTGYLGVSQQQFKTRLGSGDLADWTAQIQQDVDMWYSLYGSSMGGIFFDEGWNDCGPDNIYAELYALINRYTKIRYPGAFTVVNPGAPMPQCFENFMDTLLTFESSYASYTSGGFVSNGWQSSDLRKIWHIVYDVPEDKIADVAQLALSRGAGSLEITTDIQPNPYDNLPSDSYMQSHINAVAGGTPMRRPPSPWPGATGGSQPSTPSGLVADRADYSSAHLSWSPSTDAVAYKVQLGDDDVAMVPSSMTGVTIGGLAPGSSNTLVVYAVGASGVTSGGSNVATALTMSLPYGYVTVTNSKSTTGPTTTTVQADILVPYAFVRLYIWDSVLCNFADNPGWPIDFNTGAYVCTHYMVEGTTLYKYSGTVTSDTTNIPWAWTAVSTAPLTVEGYTYTWSLPIGTSTASTQCFVVQFQKYNPLGNAFTPTPLWTSII